MAEAIPGVISYGDLSTLKQGRARMVFYVLSQLLNKAPLQVLMGISDNNGYEAWRSLKRDYEPDSGSRRVAMLSNVLRPSFEGTLPEFWEKLRKWHNEVENYEASSGEELTDNMKAGIVIQAAPREIREKLQLQDFATYSNLLSRIEHYIHTIRVWSSGSGDTPLPMDVGQVASLSKGGGGKKGDKGKGKKGQSKDKGT